MKKQSFIKGVLILMISQAIVKILGLIYKLYLTNKDGFGDTGNAIYVSGFQIYALLLTVSSIGVPNAVAKLVSEKESIGDIKGANRTFKVSFAIFAFIGFVNSVFMFLGSKVIANEWLQIPQAELTLQALSPSIFFVSILSVFRGYFNAKGNMKPTAKSQTIEQLIKATFTIIIVEIISIFIITPNNTEIMAAGANLATTLATVTSFIYLLICYKNYRTDKIKNTNYPRESIYKIVKSIIYVALPITITAILGTINKNIDSMTVVRGLKSFMSNQDATIQYGILSGKVDTLVTLPMSLNMALTISLLPAISSAKARGDIEEIRNKISFAILLTIVIALPATVGMIIFAEPILKLLFPKASTGTFILQITAISIVFVLLNQTITSALQGLGKQFVPAISLLAGVVFKLIINLTLIPINPEKFILGGTIGASIGTIACYLIATTINLYILNRNIKFLNIKFFIKPIVSVVIMVIFSTIALKNLNLFMDERISVIVCAALAGIIYISMILSFGTFKGFNKKSRKTQPKTSF